MAYKEKEWKSYGRDADFIEMIIRDGSRRKIDVLRAHSNKDLKICLGILRKYGFDTRDEKQKKKEGFKEEMKDFLKSDVEW